MKSILAATLASIVLTGSAMAAEGLKIESEAQFARDYGDKIEQISPGVYLIVAGDLAGKTVSIGEAGLDYDLGVQRAQLNGSSRSKAQTRALIRQMEGARARYATARAQLATDVGTRKAASAALSCVYYSYNGQVTYYSGSAQVNATTGLYLDNGGGGLNFYYARASASATANVFRPWNVPASITNNRLVRAENFSTGQVIQKTGIPGTNGTTSTGYVYSGPAFSHNLSAFAAVSGSGDCFGYVSISDAMP